jgi:hypothetical protein
MLVLKETLAYLVAYVTPSNILNLLTLTYQDLYDANTCHGDAQ